MKKIIISYSFTGNNHLLAKTLSKQLQCDHVAVTDKRDVSVKSIMLDLIFHRKPKNNETPHIIKQYDLVIFIAPFWVGKIARPLIPFFKTLKNNPKPYAFITVSGGALGKNEKFQKELFKRIKQKPFMTKEFYTSDMTKQDVDMKKTSTYKIDQNEATIMSNSVLEMLQKS